MNSDPVRLLDDAEADAGLRGDLRHAAQAQVQGLSHEAGLARLHDATRATAGSAAGLSSRTKVGIGVAVAVAVALWLGMGDPASAPEPASGTTVAKPQTDVQRAPAVARSEPVSPVAPPVAMAPVGDEPPAPEGDEPAPEASVGPESAPAPEVSPVSPAPEPAVDAAPRRRTAKPAAPEPAAPSAADVLDEARLVARARASLTTDPQRSLSLAEQAEEQFPQGQLVEERRAIAIRALVALGRHDEARRRADVFLAKFSKGAHAQSVRRALDGEP